MRAILVQHEEHEGVGLFGPALQAAGFELVTRFRAAHADDAAAELFVVLGGTSAAFDTTSHPFLAQELAVLEQRLRRGRPCLGICLGAQLMARAAGARTFRGSRGEEIGARPVRWQPAARQDPVLAPPAATMVVAQWHRDTWSAVPGATWLATSDRYHQQAFRLGPSYAFQFHLELDGDTLQRWLAGAEAELRADGHDPGALLGSVPRLLPDAEARLALIERLAHHFADSGRGPSPAARSSEA